MQVTKITAKLLAAVMLLTTVTACGSGAGNGAQQESTQSTGGASAGASYKWSVSSGLAVGTSWDLALNKFAEMLGEKSGGAIELTVYSGGTLGSAKETLEGVQMGSIDFIVESSASFSNFTNALAVYDLPYLFKDEQEARKALSGEAAKKQLEELEANGYKGINYWENGIYAIGSTKPINTMADIKGLRIRSIDSALQADTYACFGASPVVLSWGDIYTSIQQGVVDGVSSTTVPNMFSANFYEVAPNITLSNHGYSPAPLVMNLNLWNSLPEDIQKIIMECAEEARQYEYQVCDEILSDCQKKMEEKGATFIELDITEWANAVQPIYDKYVGQNGIDAAVVDALRADATA